MRRRVSPLRFAALLAAAIVVIAAGLVALVFFSQSSLDIARRTDRDAASEMDEVRARFGEAPCLGREPGDDDQARTRPGAPSPATVHLLAWERGDQRLVRVTAPFWALRAGSWKMNVARGIAPILDHVTVTDVGRCGRGLILDRRMADGGRLLIWAE